MAQKKPAKRSTRRAVKQPENENALLEMSPAKFREVSGNNDEMLGVLLVHGAAAVVGSMTGARDAPRMAIADLATSVLASVEPKSGVEGLLAGQMASTHVMAVEFSRRALNAQDRELLVLYANLSDRLSRTFTRQVEALARLRGHSSKQTVRVEHVSVAAGGQAIVGAVAQKGPRRDTE